MRKFDKLNNITKRNQMLNEGFVGPGSPISQKFAELAMQHGVRTVSTASSPITPEDALALIDRNQYNHDLITWMEQNQGVALEDNSVSSKIMIGGEVFLIPNQPSGNEGEFYAAYEQQIKPELGGMNEDDVNEISGETFKSAVNQTRDKKQYPRTSRLGDLFLNKINGMNICGGQVVEATVLNDSNTMRAILTIQTESGKQVNVYDVTNDEWFIRTGPMDRRSARTLSQIAQKFNEDTKYVNFQDNFIIKGVHTEETDLTEDFGGEKEYYDHILQGHEATEENAYDHARGIDWMAVETSPQNLPNLDFIDSVNGVEIYYDHGADYYCFSPETGDDDFLGENKKPKSLNVLNETSQTMFEKLCGVKIIKESNDSSESKRKYDEVDAVMAKLGIALTTHGDVTHGVRVDGELRVFRSSSDEANMVAQKLGSLIKDKSISVVDLSQNK